MIHEFFNFLNFKIFSSQVKNEIYEETTNKFWYKLMNVILPLQNETSILSFSLLILYHFVEGRYKIFGDIPVYMSEF